MRSFLISLFLLSLLLVTVKSEYMLGVGRYDITGPAVQIEMMGMANPTQIAHGIHFRQFSRAFIIADVTNATNRVVFVSIDACMGTQVMKMKVVQKLQSRYGNMYTDDNVCISGTHTHSGPAGYFQYLLYEVMSLGFVQETLDALVDGIVESIARAHNTMVKGKLLTNVGPLLNASRNRSPTAYQMNPDAKDYQYDTDKNMTVVKFVDLNGNPLGMISWFAVHCTSMNNTNPFISGDNKGYASLLHEKYMDPTSLPGKSKFVAAYAQSNEGDVTPNIEPQHCPGHPDIKCDDLTSRCQVGSKSEFCIAFGPGKDMFESTAIIGTRQYEAAKALLDAAKVEITGPIKYKHVFRDMSTITLEVDGKQVHTCPPAMGDSFAAGTIDGPGAFSFHQNDTTGNKLWDIVGHLIHEPSKQQEQCHHPKPILLDIGEAEWPYPWAPKVVPLQIFGVGQMFIVAVPAEFTTMSGRHLRAAISKVLNESKVEGNPFPVIAGLANTYSDYVATYYEYQQQRYEAASTIFGPYTLDAYIQEYTLLAKALVGNGSIDAGPSLPDYTNKQISLHFPLLKDKAPSGKNFGDVKTDVQQTYKKGDVVEVEFWSGNPRYNRMTENTYLTVDLQASDGSWSTLYTDSSFETRFSWKYDHSDVTCIVDDIFGGCTSYMTIQWFIPADAQLGTYRIKHFGAYNDIKNLYTGTSASFKVTA